MTITNREELSAKIAAANVDEMRVLTREEVGAVAGGWLMSSADEPNTCGTVSLCHEDGTDDSDPKDMEPEDPCPPDPAPCY